MNWYEIASMRFDLSNLILVELRPTNFMNFEILWISSSNVKLHKSKSKGDFPRTKMALGATETIVSLECLLLGKSFSR